MDWSSSFKAKQEPGFIQDLSQDTTTIASTSQPLKVAASPASTMSIASTEPMMVLSSLDDRLVGVLESAAIRLMDVSWLLKQPEDYLLERRQDLEKRELSGEAPLLQPVKAVTLIRRMNRSVGVLSYGALLSTAHPPVFDHSRPLVAAPCLVGSAAVSCALVHRLAVPHSS